MTHINWMFYLTLKSLVYPSYLNNHIFFKGKDIFIDLSEDELKSILNLTHSYSIID